MIRTLSTSAVFPIVTNLRMCSRNRSQLLKTLDSALGCLRVTSHTTVRFVPNSLLSPLSHPVASSLIALFFLFVFVSFPAVIWLSDSVGGSKCFLHPLFVCAHATYPGICAGGGVIYRYFPVYGKYRYNNRTPLPVVYERLCGLSLFPFVLKSLALTCSC